MLADPIVCGEARVAKSPQTTQKNTGPTSAPGVETPATQPNGDTVAATDDRNAAGAQHLAGTSSPNDPEKEADKGAQADAKGEAIAKEPATASPALASLDPLEIHQTARATLLGTIGDWSASGVREVARVRSLVDEHGDWSPEELGEFRAAFSALADAARDAALVLGACYIQGLEALKEKLVAEGYGPADVLSISKNGRIAVTRDGRKIGLS
ncbi:hypothetical protein [Mesorhizobium sp. KR1-2]|uniref:hypothetical protein n=1 Tax=Mesorhizobium sp. KR1-2 TaxID=3156609 RepID=UPI0032B4A5CB